MKTWKKEIQVDLFISLMSCKYGKKIKGLKQLFIYLFSKANMFYFLFFVLYFLMLLLLHPTFEIICIRRCLREVLT